MLRDSLNALPRFLRQASGEWVKANAPRLGASAAFYTLFSLAPVVVIAVAVAAVVYGQEAARSLASEIRGMAGPVVAQTIQDPLIRADQPRTGAIATLLGLAALAFGASSVFVDLHDAMNTIWHVPGPIDHGHTAPPVRLPRGAAFAMLYLVIALLLAALYKILPDVSLKWSDVALGAMTTSLPFTVGKQLIGAYFEVAGFGSAYRAAGSPIVVP